MNRKLAVCAALLVVSGTPLLAAPAAPAPEISAEGQAAGSKVVITGIRRDAAGTVTLRFQLVNGSDKEIKTYGVLGNLFTTDLVTLIDSANKKKYMVVKDAQGKCVCSELKDDVVAGSRFNLFAMFPAPPANIEKITVVVPGFEPVEAPVTAAP
jgi:hypothetical protein